MIIAVDIGNTAVKAALVEGTTVHERGRMATSSAAAADLADGLRTLADRATGMPSSILAVSVVDRWTERLERVADDLDLPLTVVAASHVPIGTALVRTDRTGPDRLVAAWAAATIHGAPAIVVDLGTATTVDAVDADGFFLGGAILPGLGTSAEALAESTSRLPRVEVELPDDVIGRETAAAMQSGIVIGHVGAVRELVARMRPRLGAGGDRAPVVVTGGYAATAWAHAAWAEPAGPDLPAIAAALEPDLLLRGLGLLAEQLAGRPRPRVGA